MEAKLSFEGPKKSVGSLGNVREDILDKLIIAIALLNIFPLVAALYRSIDIGWQNIFYFYFIAGFLISMTAYFRRKLSFNIKALIMISLCFLVGCVATYKVGLVGSGNIFLLFSVILATMFRGNRYGGIVLIGSLFIMILTMLGANQEWILFDFDIETAALAPSSWITRIIVFLFFTTVLIFSLGRLINYLVDSSNVLRDHSLELEKINKNLKYEITKRQEAEKTVQASEDKYRLLIENIPSVTWMSNEQGETLFISPNVEKVYGYTQDEIYENGESLFFGRIHPDDIDRVKKSFGLLFSDNQRFNVEYRLQNKSGEWIWINDTAFNVYEEKSEKYAYGVFSDITDRKNAEREKEKLEETLQQAQKMESIGTLAGGIAHDFNNILAPILLHAEMIIEDLPVDDPMRHDVQEIYKAGKRARDLVQQILTFARKRLEEKIVLKSSHIVKEAIKFLRSTIPTTIDIQYHYNAKHDTVSADPTQLNQIVMNLCTNAAHAMREKGGLLEITLDNEEVSVNKAEKYLNLESGRYLKLSVKDNGTGIAPEIIDKIFEPYFTTKEMGEGTGFGLATTHSIVQNYGGDIFVNSEVGKGTTFDIYLPLKITETQDIKKNNIKVSMGSEHILFVDDEESIVKIMKKSLEKLGYKVTGRTSSVEALEAFRDNPDKFNLVITDMTMPNMTGEDLTKKLIEIRPGIPVILCTGFSDKIDEMKAKEIGIRSFVMKPTIVSELSTTIRGILDKK